MLLFVIMGFAVIQAGAQKSCPDIKGMDNFDFKSYANGRWFEIGRYYFDLEENADCVFYDYSSDGSDTICVLSEVVNKKINKYTLKVVLTSDAGNTGKLFYSFYKKTGENATVYILDTDYNNYSIFYYCTYDDATKSLNESAWVKSRTPTMKPEVRDKVEGYLKTQPFIDMSRMVWDHFTRDVCLTDV